MAFQKLGKYWKIVDIKIDRQLNKANVTLVGFKDKDDAAKPKYAQHIPGYENSPQEVAAADIAYTQNASWDEDKRIILETTRSVIADLFSRRAASSSMNYDETALQSDHEVPIQPQVIIGEAAE